MVPELLEEAREEEGPPPHSIDEETMRFCLLATLFDGLICLVRLKNCAEFAVETATWWTPPPGYII